MGWVHLVPIVHAHEDDEGDERVRHVDNDLRSVLEAIHLLVVVEEEGGGGFGLWCDHRHTVLRIGDLEAGFPDPFFLVGVELDGEADVASVANHIWRLAS